MRSHEDVNATPDTANVGGPASGVVGVVGAGTMGAGIAQVALEAGHAVGLYDVSAEAVERARGRIEDGLRRRAAKRGLEGDAAEAWVRERRSRLRAAESLSAVAARAAFVVEAAVEDLDLKRAVFATLDRAAPRDAILATNTSALSVGAIASATSSPHRVLGLHFFNPAPVMPLVEVVTAPRTSDEVARRAEALVAAWGKTPVRSADVPGFIVNRVNRPFTLEPLRMLEAGDATVVELDGAVRAAGFPQGPFEHLDLVGLDVNLASSTAIHAALGSPLRLAPSALQARLVAAGRLGRKSGSGFYAYDWQGLPPRPVAGFDVPRRGPTALGPAAIVDRIRLALANEAFHAVGEGVASEDRIDLALALGAAHPEGPIAWARSRGLGEVVEELSALSRVLGARFVPAPALVRAATVGDRA